jgi:spore maturation protein CgeB
MRILILNADYPRFLTWFYRSQPELENASYTMQMAARNASLFGVANFYSSNFAALGHTAAEIHVNNPRLQAAWARERGLAVDLPVATAASRHERLPGWLQRGVAPFKPILRPLARKVGLSPRLDDAMTRILLAQIEEFRPDVVLNQDVFHVDTALARRIMAIGRPVMIGQVGVEPPRGVDWTVYDLMISQLPRIIRAFRAAGVRAELSYPAFEPAILDVLPPAAERDIEISFVGSVSVDHRQRIELLEAVAERYDLKLWGARPPALPASSPLHRCFQSEVWGAEMYHVLRRSKITLNSHIDIAGSEAGNMRLFEATGVGTFLLTDFKENLHTLLEPDRDVAVWRSIPDSLFKVEHYLHNASERDNIAGAGQATTLHRHTYRQRVSEMADFVKGL